MPVACPQGLGVAKCSHNAARIRIQGDHNDLLIENPKDKLVPKKFEFEKIFTPQMGQSDVFDAVGPLCTSVMDGYNVCIFAYGQTGSGKTYSMEGPEGDRGTCPPAHLPIYHLPLACLRSNLQHRHHLPKEELRLTHGCKPLDPKHRSTPGRRVQRIPQQPLTT